MAGVLKDLKYRYHMANITMRFIYLNAAVFVVLKLISVGGFLYGVKGLQWKVIPWIAGSSMPQEMLHRPWTLITYMFVHEGFFHLLFNMILLYFAGRIFADLLNAKRFVAVYFLGGIAGFALYFLSYNFFPVFSGARSMIFGASASIMAILVALATYTPNMEMRLILIGNVKLKYIAIFFVALDVLFLDSSNTGGRMAHIGGAIFGFLYSSSLKKGNDWSTGFYVVVNFFRDLINPRPRMKVAAKNKKKSKVKYYTSESKADNDHQQKIDVILDKISKSGYDSLTKAEKEYLFNASKK